MSSGFSVPGELVVYFRENWDCKKYFICKIQKNKEGKGQNKEKMTVQGLMHSHEA